MATADELENAREDCFRCCSCMHTTDTGRAGSSALTTHSCAVIAVPGSFSCRIMNCNEGLRQQAANPGLCPELFTAI